MACKKTTFNKLWLDSKHSPEFADWLDEVKGASDQAYCKMCKVKISLSNMGRRAIVSHTSSVKHKKCSEMANAFDHSAFERFKFTPKAEPACANSTGLQQLPLLTASSCEAGNAETAASTQGADVSLIDVKKSIHQQGLSSVFVRGDDVTRAEVLWALKSVASHYSMNSSADLKSIFQLMFPDSAIAQKVTIGSTKLAYYITYGLAPYYHNQLIRALLTCDKVVVCFDEAMNAVAQRGQMDIVLRYWNNETNTVCSRYFGSAFMGRASAEHILASFKEALVEIPLSRIMQVSMDGPAVNWKFLDLLSDSMEENGSKLLNLGSCGLHVIHGAFQSGHQATGWKVNAYLRGIYYLFKDSPARRAVYTEITGSKVFPKKFCQVRWCENVSVAERAIEVLPNVKQFVAHSKKLPITVSSTNVQELCDDKLATAKLAFFSSVAAQCEVLLRRYQTASPIAPFLYDDVHNLMRTIMKRFVKKSILDSADNVTKLMKIDLSSKDITCAHKEVDIGVAATKALSQVKLSDLERMTFNKECMTFLSTLVRKIVERSPLKYPVVRAISCLVPSTVSSCRSLAEHRMKDLAQIMYDKGIITAVTADRSKCQFIELCSQAATNLKKNFSEFSRSSDRLDTFYSSVLGQDPEFSDLFTVIRFVLTLSHGNASVESGFSVNSDMLVENLHEESLVAQRIVYDAVQSAGGIASLNIDKNLLCYVRGSNARYNEALEGKRKEAQEEDKQLADRKRAAEQIKALKVKKSKVVEEAAVEAHKIDFEIAELQKMHK